VAAWASVGEPAQMRTPEIPATSELLNILRKSSFSRIILSSLNAIAALFFQPF
jgi:hypothetical protein